MLQSLSPAAGEGQSRTVDFREAEASMYIRTIDSNPTTIIYLPFFRELDGKARLPLQLLESPSAVRRTGTALVCVICVTVRKCQAPGPHWHTKFSSALSIRGEQQRENVLIVALAIALHTSLAGSSNTPWQMCVHGVVLWSYFVVFIYVNFS